MNKLSSGLLIACLSAFWLLAECEAQEYRQLQCKQLKVAGPDEWSPNSFFDEKTNSFRGLGYSILQRVAESEGIPYVLLPAIPWQRVLKYARQGEVDIIVAIYQNIERQQYIEFSEPYISNDARLYVRKGEEFTYRGFDDLVDKRGLLPSGASYGEEFDSFAKRLELIGKHNISDIFLYLSRGAADYAIQEKTRARHFIAQHQLGDRIVELPLSLSIVPVRMGFSLHSKCENYLNRFKQRYAQLLTSEELHELSHNQTNIADL